MCFYWIKYQTNQDHFVSYRKPHTTNLGDYFSKHQPPHHNMEMQPIYLHTKDTTYKGSERVC